MSVTTTPTGVSYCVHGHLLYENGCTSCEIALCSNVIHRHDTKQDTWSRSLPARDYEDFVQQFRDRLAAALLREATR